MIHEKKNYSFKQPKVADGDEFVNCNFTQLFANTEIGKGKKGLKFVQCNLLNCKVPKDAVVESCLVVQKSFCGHLHPTWNLNCVDDCEHVVDTNRIEVDGKVVSEERVYQDLLVEG